MGFQEWHSKSVPEKVTTCDVHAEIGESKNDGSFVVSAALSHPELVENIAMDGHCAGDTGGVPMMAEKTTKCKKHKNKKQREQEQEEEEEENDHQDEDADMHVKAEDKKVRKERDKEAQKGK